MDENIESCHKCGIKFDCNPHNLWFTSGNEYFYKCNECIILEAKRAMLDAISKVAHSISFGDIKKLVDNKITEH